MTGARACAAVLHLLLLLILASAVPQCSSFTLVMMGSRKGKGNLKRSLDPATVGDGGKSNVSKNDPVARLNNGKGQEITGVTLPADGHVKGWEFGKNQKMACVNVDGNLYALQGLCPRCGFDLFKGSIVNDPAFGKDIPRLACPTCSTTFSLRTGEHGPSLKTEGLAGFISGLAKTATVNEQSRDAKAFVITRDPDGRVYCREK